jgi:hypothetical protein
VQVRLVDDLDHEERPVDPFFATAHAELLAQAVSEPAADEDLVDHS